MPALQSAKYSNSRRGRWHIVQSLFFIFVFSLAVFFFLHSPVFSVKEITVTGNKQLGQEEVVTLAGLNKGVNIFKANLIQAKDRVAVHPLVMQVEISRDFPSTIIIDITERKAIGLVPDRGWFIVVSEDGCYLARVSSLSSINLPIITGVTPGSVGPGQRIPGEKLKAALDYLNATPLNIRAAISEINVSDLNNIRIFTMDKAEVRFGDTARIKEKIQLYQEVISQQYQESIQYIDISYKGNPVIKFIERPRQEKEQQP